MKVTTADRVRLGPDVAAVKQQTSQGKWRQIVQTAHKQGFTVGGALSNVPNALKERTPASLAQEATRTVGKAYKPAEQSLFVEQGRLGAINAKRAADAAVYQQWLVNQTNDLNAKARAADTAMYGLNQSTAAAEAQDWQSAKSEALQHATNLAGSISDPNQSTAMAGVDAAAKLSGGKIDAALQQSGTIAGSHNEQDNFLSAAVLANSNAMQAKVQGEAIDSQSKLDAAVQELKGQKAGDYQKILTGLQNTEITKANDNRDYAAAAQKLGVEQQKIDLSTLVAKQNYGLKVKTLNLDKWKASNADSWHKAQTQLGYDKIKSTEGKAAADRALRKWIAQHKPGKGGKSGFQETDAQKKTSMNNYRSVETVRSFIFSHPKKTPAQIDATLRGQGYDEVTIRLAQALHDNQGTLPPSMLTDAHALRVARYYPKAKNPPNQRQPGSPAAGP